MKHLLNSLLFSLAVVFIANDAALACSCLYQTNREHFEKAAIVFAGKVQSLEKVDGYGSLKVKLEISKSFKGVTTTEPMIVSTGPSSAMCGVGFEIGKEYLVFGMVQPGRTEITTNICNGSRGLSYPTADADLAELSRLGGKSG